MSDEMIVTEGTLLVGHWATGGRVSLLVQRFGNTVAQAGALLTPQEARDVADCLRQHAAAAEYGVICAAHHKVCKGFRENTHGECRCCKRAKDSCMCDPEKER